MFAALVSYCILGPGLWALFALSMLLSYERLTRLQRRKSNRIPETPPRVSVLIPAKDEGEPVRKCLDAALALDYPNFDIIAIDDRSRDNTAAIFDEYAAMHPDKVTALHITELPAGWLGKCNALASAEANANGDWILFVDSDVKVDPHALSAALGIALERGYDAISIMPRLECHTFWEHLVLPLCAASVGAMCLMLYTNDDNRKSSAFANGQFILVRRSAYQAIGGHGAVRDQITEDVALFRKLKSAGHRVRVYFGRDLAQTRMHATLGQMFHGWARIFSGVTNRRPWSILMAMLFTLSGIVAFPAFVYAVLTVANATELTLFNVMLQLAAGLHLALLLCTVALIYHIADNPKFWALLFPIAGPMMLAIYAFALRACRTGRIAWRGTAYQNGSGSDAHLSKAQGSALGPRA
jgi:cellulose synthase/poly-beta-1,6-N-acetylglucosamine synthase-like glycosyltransferase